MSPARVAAGVLALLLAGFALWRRRRLGTERAGLALLAAAALGVYASGVLSLLPDPKKLIGDAAHALGPWTYALVAVFAFLETGAFVGLVAPGETIVMAGGVGVRRAGRHHQLLHRPPARARLHPAPRAQAEDHARAPRAGRGLLRAPRWQDHPRGALHRPGEGAGSVRRGLLRLPLSALPSVQRGRHRALGHAVLRSGLRLLAVVRPCGARGRPGGTGLRDRRG